MVVDLRYFNSLEHEVDSLKSQLDTQKTQFLNEIDQILREYYYVDHMNAILGMYTKMDEVTNLQCDYLEALKKCERLEKELSKSRTMSKSFEALQKHAINLELALKQYVKAQLQDKGITITELKKLIEKMKGKSVETKFEKSSVIRQPNAFKRMYKVHTEPNQTRTPQLPQDIRKTNKRVSFSTGVIPSTIVTRPQLKSNRMGDRVMPNNSQGKKQEVEDHRRNFKVSNNKMSKTACNDSLNAKTSNVNFVCVTCEKCVLNDNHDMCVLYYINGVNSRTRHPIAVPITTREPKQTMNQYVATSHKKTVATDSTVKKPRNIIRKLYEQVSKTCSWWYPKFTPPGYKWKPKSPTGNFNPNLVDIILFIVNSGCSKHMTGNLKLLTNFVEKFLGTIKFGNDQIALILGYGDLVQGTITIKRVYYVEGLNHNLFSVGQFCNADLKVAFRKSTCYIRDLKGNDLLTGARGTYLYSITLQETSTPNPIFLVAKATSSQAWLWHHCLSHLNFDTINLLSKNNIMTGLSKLKFVKDHLCSSCELGKAKRKSFHTKTTPRSKRRSKDKTPAILIDFLTLFQKGLHAQVTTVQTDKGMEFLNKTLHAYFAKEGIRHEMSTARTPEQNGVVERRNRTLVVAARTMLSAAKVPLFYGLKQLQPHVLLKTVHSDGENLDKMKEKVETIHVNFDELPQMASDHISSDPVPQCPTTVLEQDSLSPGPQSQEKVPQAAETVTMSNDLDFLFSPMFDELLNETTPVVSKSSAVHAADDPNKPPTQVPTITATENIIQAKTNNEYAQVDDDEFVNIFSTPIQERGETSSSHVDLSNMHTFYQHYHSGHRWTKDHPLDQVIGDPSQLIRTRHQLETDGKMCMFALTVSQNKPKNIKETMADSAWIEAMQEELHQFDRLDV
ncbi:retrovirus-related pol polyprotein from transposon TNT 1-94 [Tanacetum coccineum]